MFSGELPAGFQVFVPFGVAISAEYFSAAHVVVPVAATVRIIHEGGFVDLIHGPPPGVGFSGAWRAPNGIVRRYGFVTQGGFGGRARSRAFPGRTLSFAGRTLASARWGHERYALWAHARLAPRWARLSIPGVQLFPASAASVYPASGAKHAPSERQRACPQLVSTTSS